MDNENTKTTLLNLVIGTIVTYRDIANPNTELVVLDTVKNDFGTFVNMMNLETKNIEPYSASTKLGDRFTF